MVSFFRVGSASGLVFSMIIISFMVVNLRALPTLAQTRSPSSDSTDKIPAQTERLAFAAWMAEIHGLNTSLLQTMKMTESILGLAKQASSGSVSGQIAIVNKDQLVTQIRQKRKDLASYLERRFTVPRFYSREYIQQAQQTYQALSHTNNRLNSLITETENLFYITMNNKNNTKTEIPPIKLYTIATEHHTHNIILHRMAALRADNPMELELLHAQIKINRTIITAFMAMAKNAQINTRDSLPTQKRLSSDTENFSTSRDILHQTKQHIEAGRSGLKKMIEKIENGPRMGSDIRRIQRYLIKNYDQSLKLITEMVKLVDDFLIQVGAPDQPIVGGTFFVKLNQTMKQERVFSAERGKLLNALVIALQPPPSLKPPIWVLDDGTHIDSKVILSPPS